MLELTVVDYPGLHVGAFVTRFAEPLGAYAAAASAVAARLRLDAAAPVARSEEVRAAVRDLLRHRGYKPTGRGKPASEYLVGAAERGAIGSINLAVDACNVASLHSGLPISVVDLDRTTPPLSIGVAQDSSYVFNASGQTIDIDGLLCLFDANGPCANAVKDSQRTKTHDGSRATISIVWGPTNFASHVDATAAWYRTLLQEAGARCEDVALAGPA